MKKHFLAVLLIALAVVGFSYFKPKTVTTPSEAASAQTPIEPTEDLKAIEIPPEGTFGVLMEEAGVPPTTSTALYEAAKGVYDLASVRAGKSIDLYYPKSGGDLARLVYQIDTEDELEVSRTGDDWTAKRLTIPYEIRVKTAEGTVTSSLYEAGLAQGLDERTVITLADVFQWDIDFAQDVRVGDTFKFIYEERWRDGQYVMPGEVLAAKYLNAGDEKTAFFFKSADGEESHYDKDGRSLRRPFLKAPVAFKYITSGYTTGLRYVSAFNTSTGHRAIDYAAPSGTPVRTVGDGTVVQAGWNGSFGNFISIRHNETYTTNYAHLSRILVKRGAHVSQGDIIGKVGSTGFSTGPHLHFEMVKYGTKINPLKEKFPAGLPVKDVDKAAFEKIVTELGPKL